MILKKFLILSAISFIFFNIIVITQHLHFDSSESKIQKNCVQCEIYYAKNSIYLLNKTISLFKIILQSNTTKIVFQNYFKNFRIQPSSRAPPLKSF